MPRAEKTDPTHLATDSGAICKVCSRRIGRKSDLARHMRTHAVDKAELMHRCPFCKFANMQKSNVETHIRTHTGEKSRRCPDCTFATTDPGSLTRHRKRVHQYVPKPRSPRDTATRQRCLPVLSPSSPAPSDLGPDSPDREDRAITPSLVKQESARCVPRLIRGPSTLRS